MAFNLTIYSKLDNTDFKVDSALTPERKPLGKVAVQAIAPVTKLGKHILYPPNQNVETYWNTKKPVKNKTLPLHLLKNKENIISPYAAITWVQTYELALTHHIYFNHLKEINDLVLINPSLIHEKEAKEGMTPLHLAVLFNRSMIVKLLLQNGAKLELNNKSQNPFHLACERGYTNCVKEFINFNPKINCQNRDGYPQIYLACSRKHTELIKFFCDEGEIDKVNYWKETSLHLACKESELEIVTLLLSNHANPNICDRDKNTPLHSSSSRGLIDIVKLLCDNHAEINSINKDKNSALHFASENNQLEIVKYLIKNGAAIDLVNKNFETALHLASKYGHLEVVKYLIKSGANFNLLNLDNETPLHLASEYNEIKVVEYLINKNAKLNLLNINGESILHIAATKNQADVVKLLVTGEIEINQPNLQGNTPLHLACIQGREKIVQTLVENQAQINFQNKNKQTPLILSCEYHHYKIAEFLMEKGANIFLLSNEYSTPLIECMITGLNEKSTFLEKLIAADKGFSTDILAQIMLAHQFSLLEPCKGTAKDNLSFDLLGINQKIALQFLSIHIKSYYKLLALSLKDNPPNYLKNFFYSGLNSYILINVLKQTKKIVNQSLDFLDLPVEQILKKIQNQPVTAFLGFWSDHVIAWGFINYNNQLYFFRCNKGADRELQLNKGIRIHKIGQPKMISEVIQQFKDPDLVKDLFLEDVDSLLDLQDFDEFQSFIKQVPQKTGNCSIANSNSMELAVLFGCLLSHFPSDEALIIAKSIKDSRKRHSRINDLKDYLKTHDPQEKNETWPVNWELIDAIYEKTKKTKASPQIIAEAQEIKNIIDTWYGNSKSNAMES